MITSLSNSIVLDIKKIQQPKYRKQMQEFFIEGEHLIQEANKANILDHILITEKYEIVENIIYCGSKKILEITADMPCDYIADDIAYKITQTQTPQGIFGIAKINEVTLATPKQVLILDGLQDPGNVGTILRTASAFGITTVLATPQTVDFYNDKLIRSTQGITFFMQIARLAYEEISQYLEQNKYEVLSLDMEGIAISNMNKNDKQAIIIGNEGNGISHANWGNLKIDKVTIPMKNNVESLNVAIATGIALYEWNK
ncbi:MAG: TrmH family RNA methyltransferase [Culicoidibacterales bacterium]